VDVVDDEVGEAAIARAIGQELRRARDSAGMTRAELVAMLPSEIHVQTLATYERGVRQCTVGRFVMICQAIGVPGSAVLTAGLQHAMIGLKTNGVEVDLRAIVRDNTSAELLPLRRWARNKLDASTTGDSGIVHLEWVVVREMAAVFDIAEPEFVKYLVAFTPRPVPQRR